MKWPEDRYDELRDRVNDAILAWDFKNKGPIVHPDHAVGLGPFISKFENYLTPTIAGKENLELFNDREIFKGTRCSCYLARIERDEGEKAIKYVFVSPPRKPFFATYVRLIQDFSAEDLVKMREDLAEVLGICPEEIQEGPAVLKGSYSNLGEWR